MANKENLITTNELDGEVYLDKILADYDIFFMDCLDEDNKPAYPSKFLLNDLAESSKGKLLVCYQKVHIRDEWKSRIYVMTAKSNGLTEAKLRNYPVFKKSNLTPAAAVTGKEQISDITAIKLLTMNVPFATQLNQKGKMARSNLLGELFFYIKDINQGKDKKGGHFNRRGQVVLIRLYFDEQSKTMHIANSLFTQVKLFKEKYGEEFKDELAERNLLTGPFYRINFDNMTIRQCRKMTDDCYLKAPLIKNEKPKAIDGAMKNFALDKNTPFDHSKYGFAYQLLSSFNSYYEGTGYVSKLSFKEVKAKTISAEESSMKLNKKVTRAVADFFKDKKVHFVDQTGKELDLAPVAEYFADKTAEASCVDQVKEGFNIVVVRPSKDYKGKDPYQRSNSKCMIQHIYQDNCLKKDGQVKGKSALDNSLKELLVKYCVVNRTVKPLQVKGMPNAKFHYWEKETGTCWSLKFKDEETFELAKSNQLLDPLSENNPFIEQGLLWKDKKGRMTSDYELLAWIDGELYGIKQSKLRTMPNKSLYYRTIEDPEFRYYRNKAGLDEYMSGIVYENHWLENGCVKFNVGKVGRGMQTTIDKGSVVRIINSFSGDILEEEAEKIYRMLKMTEVTFVKYKDLTVLPYPLKLLKEAARMEIEL